MTRVVHRLTMSDVATLVAIAAEQNPAEYPEPEVRAIIERSKAIRAAAAVAGEVRVAVRR